MNFNFTLIGQLLAFILFVWFCMRYVWPPMLQILEEREKEVADGLEAASRGRRELEEANTQREAIVEEAKKEAAESVPKAHPRRARQGAVAHFGAFSDSVSVLPLHSPLKNTMA